MTSFIIIIIIRNFVEVDSLYYVYDLTPAPTNLRLKCTMMCTKAVADNIYIVVKVNELFLPSYECMAEAIYHYTIAAHWKFKYN